MCKREMSNSRDSHTVVVKGEQTYQFALAVYLLVDRTVPGPVSSFWHLVSWLTRHLGLLDESWGWDMGRKRASRVRKVAVDRLEVMQQCHSSTAARRTSRARQSGVIRTNCCGLGLIRENSENLSHAKIYGSTA